MKNPKIGLICKSHDYSEVCGSIMTGDWVISPQKIQNLIGQDVILTESSKKPAYSGGEITGYNRLSNGKYVLFFREDSRYSGYESHIANWNSSTNPVRYL